MEIILWAAGIVAAIFVWYLIGLTILTVITRFSDVFDGEDAWKTCTIIFGPLAVTVAVVFAPLWIALALLFFGGRWLYHQSTERAYSARSGNG